MTYAIKCGEKRTIMKVTKEMIMTGELPTTGAITQSFTQNGVRLSYYGGELCSASVDGRDIEKIFQMKNSGCCNEELQYFITDEALDYLVERINAKEQE